MITAAASMFWERRMTGYLVLFWYLSLRNAYRYSDPSVWEGSFIDEVTLLTAMKLNLKQIKRHFPQIDSCFFKLAQVLHLRTERWREQEWCANTLLHVYGRRRKEKELFISVVQIFSVHLLDLTFGHLCYIVLQKIKTNVQGAQDPTWRELPQKQKNTHTHIGLVVSTDTDCSSLSSYLFRFHCKACQSLPGLQTQHWIFHLRLHSSIHTSPQTTCSTSREMVNCP